MWPDNETDIDLLGFDFLVDSLEIVLMEQRLLPVTVGVTGDWGSGKSSLMQMARARLEADDNEEKYICVSFSPWRFEDYAHVKVALMTAVVDAIGERIEEDKSLPEKASQALNKVRARLAEWGLWKQIAAGGTVLAGGGLEEAAAVGQAAEAAGSLGPDPDAPKYQRSFETVAHFHVEFEELVEGLGEKIHAVVVFIDDMDRCSTTTIIETFEAMRLFLHAPKTAYVVGAHEEIVEAALDGRYPARREGDAALGHDYLEKMLQNSIAIPPLSEPEALTYINLLFAELYTDDEQFSALRQAAAEHRAKNQLEVAMNEGIAAEVIGDLPTELISSLSIAAQVGPALARGLRGNPRQLKRFLNRLLLRLRTAEKRGMELDPDKLAKLMVLEELNPAHFEKLFGWQLDADDGAPEQLLVAEQLARDENPKSPLQEAKDWVAQPGITDWLQLEPALGGVPLGPYFTFSRDRLTMVASMARLPAELQRLLAELRVDVKPKRTKAVEEATKLPDTELSKLLPALLDAAFADLRSPAANGLLELAQKRQEVTTALYAGLGDIAPQKLHGNFVLSLSTAFKDDPRLRPLLERWEQQGKSDVKRQARRALGRE